MFLRCVLATVLLAHAPPIFLTDHSFVMQAAEFSPLVAPGVPEGLPALATGEALVVLAELSLEELPRSRLVVVVRAVTAALVAMGVGLEESMRPETVVMVVEVAAVAAQASRLPAIEVVELAATEKELQEQEAISLAEAMAALSQGHPLLGVVAAAVLLGQGKMDWLELSGAEDDLSQAMRAMCKLN
jgi:hypothetical protein